MKAKSIVVVINNKSTECLIDDIEFPCIAMIKYDGFFTTIHKKEEGIHFITSGGKLFDLANTLQFESLPLGIYFAEFLGTSEGKLGDRGKAAVQTTLRVNTNKGIDNDGIYNWRIFDGISHSDYASGVSDIPFKSRFQRIIDNSDLIPEYWEVESREELKQLLEDVVALGWEGLIVNQPDMLWRKSKSRKVDHVKYKGRPTADLLCIEEVEGTGKYSGMIGALVLQDSKGRTVSVGSGLDDIDRTKHGYFKGKVIEIAYEQILDTYIQPSYKNTREDKEKGDVD